MGKNKLHQYTVLCPRCKQVIHFELDDKVIDKKLTGGLATFHLEPHGDPPHKLIVFIDRNKDVRGSYAAFSE
jgi:hypothetical protein